MKCPRCTSAASPWCTEPGNHGTLRHRYVCEDGHRFTTLEAYEPTPSSVESTALMKALRLIRQPFTPRRTTCP